MPLRNRNRGVSNAPPATTTATRGHDPFLSGGIEVAHALGTHTAGIEHDFHRHALRTDLARAAPQRAAQHRHRVALGLDRTPVERAEPAVVARRAPVVLHAVGAGGGAVRVVPEALRRGHGQRGEEHVGARRHGVRIGPPRGEGVAAGVAGHADGPFGLGVERLHLLVVDWPVGHRRALDRAELAQQAEVDLAVARQLAVGVEPRAAHRRRHVVDVADRSALAVGNRSPVAARLEQRIGTEEVAPAELHLVVRLVTQTVEGRVEREEVVATLLEDAHRPARLGEHVGGGRASGARTDHDDVELRHR